MIPYAPVRAAVVVGLLLWAAFMFGGSFLGLIEPPKRVRATDAVATQSDGPLSPSAPPSPPREAMSEPQALETLRQAGYFDASPLVQQSDGAWDATAAHAGVSGKVGVRVERDGRVTER